MAKEVATQIENGIATISIDRPKALNALNQKILSEIEATLTEVLADSSVRVVVLRGTGEKAFVAGADIAEMNALGTEGIESYVNCGQRVMNQLEAAPVPVIAAVDGFALGGGLELALACDIIVAKEGAKVGLPEVTLGLIPGFGGTQRLVQRVGIGRAKRLIFSGQMIEANEAYALGIVDQVVAADEYEAAVSKLAVQIASRAPLAVAAAKRAVQCFSAEAQGAGLKREVAEFVGVFASADASEGVSAFLEKRPPNFVGK